MPFNHRVALAARGILPPDWPVATFWVDGQAGPADTPFRTRQTNPVSLRQNHQHQAESYWLVKRKEAGGTPPAKTGRQRLTESRKQPL